MDRSSSIRKPLGGLALVAISLALPLVGQEPIGEMNSGQAALKCEKAIEVGTYYYNKKNYEAAINRFHEAIAYRPKYAKPHYLLAQALEKKGQAQEAVAEYRRYLELWPNAPDFKRVQEHAEKLERTRGGDIAKRKSSP